MNTRVHTPLGLWPLLLLIFCIWPVGLCLAGEVQRVGNSYVVYLPGNLNYDEVVDRVQTEILAQNWDIVNVQDIDVGLRQLGVLTHNKVIQACQSQYLKQAILDDPFITMIIPCRFAVFQEHVPETAGGDYEAALPRIVVGFSDPVTEAKALGIKRYQAAETAAEELKAVLRSVADYYAE